MGLKPKNKGHMNFYECCDLTEKVYLIYIYTYCIVLYPIVLSVIYRYFCSRDVVNT